MDCCMPPKPWICGPRHPKPTPRVEWQISTVSPKAHYNQKPSLHPPEGGATHFLRPGEYLGILGWRRQVDGQHFGSLVCLVLALIQLQAQTKTSSSIGDLRSQSYAGASWITSIGRCTNSLSARARTLARRSIAGLIYTHLILVFYVINNCIESYSIGAVFRCPPNES